ncbi:MAG: D-glycero-beta-D-manno-heptose 1-phosphate adenylyltransferase [Saprospiraceae bacterium]|nr:D-glycero-beta-D-manno-heptose 1-phosphate adenylyltransferase [Saprospiraceae bacterium]
MEALPEIAAKIMDRSQAQQRCTAWKDVGETVVFTNGCFDILHYGHLHYLAQARDLGDRLIVGMNAGSSVSRLKGSHRPINDETTRTMLMASLAFVDAVVLFEEDTPLGLIQLLLPDVLVKGGDWRPDQIVGSELVLEHGGQVLSLPFIEGYSTTAIEEKIRSW